MKQFTNKEKLDILKQMEYAIRNKIHDVDNYLCFAFGYAVNDAVHEYNNLNMFRELQEIIDKHINLTDACLTIVESRNKEYADKNYYRTYKGKRTLLPLQVRYKIKMLREVRDMIK